MDGVGPPRPSPIRDPFASAVDFTVAVVDAETRLKFKKGFQKRIHDVVLLFFCTPWSFDAFKAVWELACDRCPLSLKIAKRSRVAAENLLDAWCAELDLSRCFYAEESLSAYQNSACVDALLRNPANRETMLGMEIAWRDDFYARRFWCAETAEKMRRSRLWKTMLDSCGSDLSLVMESDMREIRALTPYDLTGPDYLLLESRFDDGDDPIRMWCPATEMVRGVSSRVADRVMLGTMTIMDGNAAALYLGAMIARDGLWMRRVVAHLSPDELFLAREEASKLIVEVLISTCDEKYAREIIRAMRRHRVRFEKFDVSLRTVAIAKYVFCITGAAMWRQFAWPAYKSARVEWYVVRKLQFYLVRKGERVRGGDDVWGLIRDFCF